MLYSYNKDSKLKQLLSSAFSEFDFNDCTITFSDELPPIFQKNPDFKGRENEELPNYPVDLLMGAYYPESERIVIYLQGINKVVNAKDRNYNYEHLLELVILHEIGHYWYHSMRNTYTYSEDSYVEEWVAQMFAFLVIHDNSELTESMDKLSKHQPIKYQTYKENTLKNVKEFLEKLGEKEDNLVDHVMMLVAVIKYNS